MGPAQLTVSSSQGYNSCSAGKKCPETPLIPAGSVMVMKKQW